jgi:hypothetical protein
MLKDEVKVKVSVLAIKELGKWGIAPHILNFGT